MKKMLMLLFVVALLMTTATAFAFAASEEKTIETLIAGRIEAMNGFFSSQLAYKEAEEYLRQVEGGSLLTEDLHALRTYFRTDVDRITDWEIEEIKITAKDDDVLCAWVTIAWETADLEGIAKIRESYSVICAQTDGTYRLVQFF